jgi:hypothetical protein
MIAKGASRSGARQLAVYLMRVERWDTGEPAELLELRSPWAAGIDGVDRHHTADQLIEAFRDWQTLVEGTKQGRDGLYHAEINPEAHYAKNMTPEEWKRSADILAEELGLQDQPRALVLHAGKDDRPHLHVVWQRTDVDTMKVISDSYNYVAHERASQRMELEFGHEFIPGKHAKRDRKRQEDFPRQKLTQDEDQYQKRTGLYKEDRVREIAAMRAAADGGTALKAALEDAGYVLAKGDRGYVVVDERGGHSVLTRNVGMKKKELEAFMAGVGLDKLPTVEEAKALQTERRKAKTVSKSDGLTAPEKQPEKKGVEASRFLQPQTIAKEPERAPAPPDAELEALKKAIAEREAKEAKQRAELHDAELRQFQIELDALTASKTADFDRMQQQERNRLKARQAGQRKGLKGFMDAVHDTLKTKKAAEKAKQLRRETAQLKARQDKERRQYIELLEKNRRLEIENLKERQAQRDQQQELKQAEERERYIREYEEAKRIREQIEADRRKEELERNENLRDGPPPPKLGK